MDENLNLCKTVHNFSGRSLSAGIPRKMRKRLGTALVGFYIAF